MTPFPLLDLLDQITAQPGTTDVTLKANGTVAVVRNGGVSITRIPALAETWIDSIRQLGGGDPRLSAGTCAVVAPDASSSRYRLTFARNHDGDAATVRPLPKRPPTPDQLRLPEGVKERFARLASGLFIIGGPAGSGKTSTAAALLSFRAETRGGKFITLERPVEFLHDDSETAVFQHRDRGPGCAAALEQALLEHPDVLAIGDLRSREDAEHALTAALGGHVVLATMHAATAWNTPRQFLAMLDPGLQDPGAREALALALEAIVVQRLVPGFEGLVPIFETLYLRTVDGARLPQMERHLRRADFIGLRQEIETSAPLGMMLFEECLAQRRRERLIPE